MIDTKLFVEQVVKRINFFTGIPDSVLKDFNNCLMEFYTYENHIIPANEGSAVALAAGYYLSQGKIGLIYMQNSGLGNALNPLVSLVDKYVYQIPVILMIGYRGEAGIKDEPQHLKQGYITLDLLKILDIPYVIIPDDLDGAVECLNWAVSTAEQTSSAVAVVVRKSTFSPYKSTEHSNNYILSRENAIETIIKEVNCYKDYKIFSTTGMISRELYEIRKRNKQSNSNDFLSVGSMGHVSQIALGYALKEKNKKIICLDGDGSIIMHMGNLATIGMHKLDNFIHIILNNCSHDSVGGSPTVFGDKFDILKIAEGCGYSYTARCKNVVEIESNLSYMLKNQGKFLIEIQVAKGARKNLGRPDKNIKYLKEEFMDKHI